MENYEVLGEIGKGSFGSVHKIKRIKDGKVLVWKELDYGKMSEKEKQQLVSEVNILRDLKHPNVVRYYDRVIDKSRAKIFIVMEYCEGGDMGLLLKRCRKEKDYIGEDVVWKVFMQIILALYECHHRKEGKILHRDLKPGNVFFDSRNNVKLGDFGLARVLSKDSQYACTHVGTPYYMSPEQIKDSKYNEKSDIWSAGCVLYEMAALKPPFEAANQLSLAAKIKAGKFERLPPKYSEELNRVVAWMLRVSPEERPTVDDLLNIPQISLRLREKRLRENQGVLQRKQEDLLKKEETILAKEKTVAQLKKIMEDKKKALDVIERRVDDLKRKSGEAKSANVTVVSDKENVMKNGELGSLEDKIKALTMGRDEAKRPGTAFSGIKKRDKGAEPTFTKIGVSAKKRLAEEIWSKKI
eukprot:TRINITY_DN135175_c0_g1_i1.p1 TRINITY_DN135175_c0_g1~~TRINITY_DN135175_c0_g1_i1.p1  ORF type:complete len:442 (+),score=56.24 TRINITY_DN135175_c0_g1_i1:93-1328(+)